MLTAELVHARRRGDELHLVALTPEERERALALAEDYVGLARAHLGRERGALLEACKQIPVPARDRRLGDGLLKLVLDRCVFEEAAPEDLPALRSELFARAAAHRRTLPPRVAFERGVVLAEVAAARGLEPEAIDQALYADLPEAHQLRSVDLPGPRALVAAYEEAGVQAVLLRAVSVLVRVTAADPAAFRQLFRKLKFLRLLHRITPIAPARKPVAPTSKRGPPATDPTDAAGYEIIIDGPFSLFESVTKYGLQLALAFPAIAACGRWTMEADVRWGKERRPLRFRQQGTALASTDDEPPPPPEVERLLAELATLETPWRARPARTLLDLPGEGVLVPNLELRHAERGDVVHVEVLGFWSRDAVWRRIELAERGLPVPVVFAVSKHLRVSEEALPESVPAALYVYARTLSPRALLERVEAAARPSRPGSGSTP